MLTITIIFALLVALWGFSGALVSHARRSIAQARSRPRPVAAQRSPSRARGVASASR